MGVDQRGSTHSYSLTLCLGGAERVGEMERGSKEAGGRRQRTERAARDRQPERTATVVVMDFYGIL